MRGRGCRRSWVRGQRLTGSAKQTGMKGKNDCLLLRRRRTTGGQRFYLVGVSGLSWCPAVSRVLLYRICLLSAVTHSVCLSVCLSACLFMLASSGSRDKREVVLVWYLRVGSALLLRRKKNVTIAPILERLESNKEMSFMEK